MVGCSSHSTRARTVNFFDMNKLVVLISESYQEMVNKVTWPSLNSLQSSSVLVLIASLIFALFITFIGSAGAHARSNWASYGAPYGRQKYPKI